MGVEQPGGEEGGGAGQEAKRAESGMIGSALRRPPSGPGEIFKKFRDIGSAVVRELQQVCKGALLGASEALNMKVDLVFARRFGGALAHLGSNEVFGVGLDDRGVMLIIKGRP